MLSAMLVGDYIVASGQGLYTPMQVLKLTYIGNGFTLAINDEPLFHDRIEAWEYGPVIPNLYQIIKEHGFRPIPRLYSTNEPVSSEAAFRRMKEIGRSMGMNRDVLDQVLDGYGGYEGETLSSITHARGSPWDATYDKNDHHKEISAVVIKRYYKARLDGT